VTLPKVLYFQLNKWPLIARKGQTNTRQPCKANILSRTDKVGSKRNIHAIFMCGKSRNLYQQPLLLVHTVQQISGSQRHHSNFICVLFRNMGWYRLKFCRFITKLTFCAGICTVVCTIMIAIHIAALCACIYLAPCIVYAFWICT